MSITNDRAFGLISTAGHFNSSHSVTIVVEDGVTLTLSNTIIAGVANTVVGRTSVMEVTAVDTGAYIISGDFTVCYAHTVKSSKDDFIYDVGFRTAITRALSSVKDTTGRFNTKEFKAQVWDAYNESVNSFKVAD